MKILAVDDDNYVLQLLQVVLAKSGYRDITFCLSADQALEKIRAAKSPFGCILLDVQMPQTDGITLCRKIRAIERYHDTPIVMLTAKKDPMSVQSAFAAGATDYVTKPFDVNEISARIGVAKQINALQNELKALRRASQFDAVIHRTNPNSAAARKHAGKDYVTRQEIAEFLDQELPPFPAATLRAARGT